MTDTQHTMNIIAKFKTLGDAKFKKDVEDTIKLVDKGAISSAAAQKKISRAEVARDRIISNNMEKEMILQTRRNAYVNLAKKYNTSIFEVDRALKAEGNTINDLGEVEGYLGTKVKNVNASMTQGFAKTRRFKGELLSVMFAGMALQRAFQGIIDSSFELWGITDLMSIAWDVTMLPVMSELAPFIYNLAGGFMNLDENTQKAIGSLVLFATAAGYIISGLAMTGLAWEGLLKMFPGLEKMGMKGSLKEGIKIGITFGLLAESFRDLSQGEILAGMGTALAAAGLWVINKNPTMGAAMIGIGIGLKFIDDENFAVGITKMFIKIGNTITTLLMEAIKVGLTMGMYKPSADKITGLDFYAKAVEQVSIETAGQGLAGSVFGVSQGPIYPTESTRELRTETDALFNEFMSGKLTMEDYQKKLDKLKTTYPEQVKLLDEYGFAMARYSQTTKEELTNALSDVSWYTSKTKEELNGLIGTWTSIHEIRTIHTSDEDDEDEEDNNDKKEEKPSGLYGIGAPNLIGLGYNFVKDLFSGKSEKNLEDGIITPSGVVSTAPDDYIIATKDPTSLGGGKGVTLNVTYNVNVSDKRDLERMFRENNTKLTQEVMRIVKV